MKILFVEDDLETARYVAVGLEEEGHAVTNSADGRDGLRAIVTRLAERAPAGIYYLLENASGRVLAGNAPALKPVVGVQSWKTGHNHHRTPHLASHVWGRGVSVAEGGYLYVRVDNFEVNEMQELITRSSLWALGATIVLALTGSALMSLGLLRRLESISQTSRSIVAGDLSQRIAVRGTDDEFDHLAASLNAMLDRIEALMEGLHQVSNDIAHDLRTPLTRLRQRLEFAHRHEQTVPALYAALEGSIENADRIQVIDTCARSYNQVRTDISVVWLSCALTETPKGNR